CDGMCIRPDGGRLIQADTALAQLGETGLRIALPRMAPRRLDGGAQCSSLAVRGADDRCIHDIGDDLPPQWILCAATDQTNPFAANTAVTQQIQAVTQAEGHALEHRAAEIGPSEVVAGQAMKAGAGLG